MIYQVPTKFLDGIWPSIEEHVSRACDYHPFMEAKDVLELLRNEMASLFISTDGKDVMGFGVLEVVKYPRRTVANILGAGGRSGFLAVAIHELLPAMIDYGKTQGATVVALSGRPGWLRALRQFNGSSKRFVTWWADIDEQGWRRTPDNHTRAVETSTALPH